MRLIMASNNRHKVMEVRDILAPFGFEVIPMSEAGFAGVEIEEGIDSFEENSRLKAEYLYRLSNEAVIADDSGLEVDALEGAPGVISARYAGEPADVEKNNDLLLKNLESFHDPADRTARFCCVITLILPGSPAPKYITARGDLHGSIGFERKGSGGFGYDPLFVLADHSGQTMAELSEAEKNAISHRSRALKQLVVKLKSAGIGA